MNKQVEQIRAEIERRLRLLEHGDADIEVMKRVEGVIKGYKAVLSFIDSIPEEPVSEDLDKAIEDAMPGVPAWHIDEVGDDSYENAYNSDQMAEMFKNGVNWQKQKAANKSIAVLTAKIDELNKKGFVTMPRNGEPMMFSEFAAFSREEFDAVIENAKTEERRRMMRDAINGYIERDMGGQLIVGKTNLGAADEFMLLNSQTFRDVKCGERYNVKLIIIKED